MTSHPISEKMKKHYAETFIEHGCNSQGVDWGEDENRASLRHQMVCDAFRDEKEKFSILDVGCGYGAFLQYLKNDDQVTSKIDFYGIDVVSEMIEKAQSVYPEASFLTADILNYEFRDQKFDYVVCNGILTQKLTATDDEMKDFAHQLIKRMFSLCQKGIVFNTMTSYVNFKVDNLFYNNPIEMLNWIMQEISPHVKLNHAYPLYEYMIYAYTNEAVSK